MFGGYQGWTAPSLVKLLSDEYPIPISQEDASIVATIGCLGHVIGGFLGSSLSDLIGRKTTIMSIGIPQVHIIQFTVPEECSWIFFSYKYISWK